LTPPTEPTGPVLVTGVARFNTGPHVPPDAYAKRIDLRGIDDVLDNAGDHASP
jgi:hypothetical protein